MRGNKQTKCYFLGFIIIALLAVLIVLLSLFLTKKDTNVITTATTQKPANTSILKCSTRWVEGICEDPDSNPCENAICHNNGTCNLSKSKAQSAYWFICDCPENLHWVGHDCQTRYFGCEENGHNSFELNCIGSCRDNNQLDKWNKKCWLSRTENGKDFIGCRSPEQFKVYDCNFLLKGEKAYCAETGCNLK